MSETSAFRALQATCDTLQAEWERALDLLASYRHAEPETWVILAALSHWRRWQDAMKVKQEVAYRQATWSGAVN